MRQFRFRLDPVIRIKEYEIQRKEEEISDLENRIQQFIREIEEGRHAVEAMRQRMLEGAEDKNILRAEQSLDMFRAYTTRVEQQKRTEIGKLRQEQEEKRRELLKLYQDEKILQKLKEKRKLEWEKETRREEAAMMDEIGTQKYVRRTREHGGVFLYLLVPVLLAGAAAAVGMWTGVVDKSMLERIPYLNMGTQSATTTVSPVSATDEGQFVTPEDLFGPIDAPMPEVLENIRKIREQNAEEYQRLKDWENELQRRESLLNDREQLVSGWIQQTSDLVSVYEQYRQELEEREKSKLSEREQKMAEALSAGNEKTMAQLAVSLFQAPNALTPEEAEKDKMVLLRILHKMPPQAFDTLLAAIAKTDPQTGAEILKMYMETDENELYEIDKPSIPKTLPVDVTTGEALPPPVKMTIENGNNPPDG